MTAWLMLADDVMARLSAHGVRPTPRRYAVVSHLAEYGALEPTDAVRCLRGRFPGLTPADVRRIAQILVRVGVVEPINGSPRPRYHLLPAPRWPAVNRVEPARVRTEAERSRIRQ
jgi:Fe2+ or Zn2+ uptake regulation protein